MYVLLAWYLCMCYVRGVCIVCPCDQDSAYFVDLYLPSVLLLLLLICIYLVFCCC